MTSEERREARYRRRFAKRQNKKNAIKEINDNFDIVFSYKNLYQSYRRCRRGCAWKASVQKYIANAPFNVYETYIKLQLDKYRSPGFYEFDLFERGKARHIKSTTIGERVVQRCLCDNALIPVIARGFIHDNGASLKNKGYDFAVRRITQHLREHIRKYGNEGYILLFDFSKFFDNVSHQIVKSDIRKKFSDEKIVKLTESLIDAFGDKGMGLGSQISQVLALSSANKLDHYIKEKLRIRGYGRYMDDGYLIHPSKEYLQKCLNEIYSVCDELDITLNKKKTQIVKLSHGFSWLKIRFYITDNGKVIKKIYKRSITIMRRKLKKLQCKFLRGEIAHPDIVATWNSWRSYANRFDSWHTVNNMRELYHSLFPYEHDRRNKH